LEAIIGFVAIDVTHDLVGLEVAPELALHHETMLPYVTGRVSVWMIARPNQYVPTLVDGPSTSGAMLAYRLSAWPPRHASGYHRPPYAFRSDMELHRDLSDSRSIAVESSNSLDIKHDASPASLVSVRNVGSRNDVCAELAITPR